MKKIMHKEEVKSRDKKKGNCTSMVKSTIYTSQMSEQACVANWTNNYVSLQYFNGTNRVKFIVALKFTLEQRYFDWNIVYKIYTYTISYYSLTKKRWYKLHIKCTKESL